MGKVYQSPFSYPLVVFESAIAHDTEADSLFEKVVSLSTLITAGKGQIVKTKRFLNEAVVARKHYKLLCAYNLPSQIEEPSVYLASIREAIKEYTEELHTHQKDLRKIYVEHNKTVEELKNVIGKYARNCAIRHTRQTRLKDAGDNKEQSLTTLNLSRVGVLTLIKKLSDEIKAKPNCNNFTITINTGVTKG